MTRRSSPSSPAKFWKGKRILLTGGSGFLGQHVHRMLSGLELSEIRVPRSADTDLRNPEAVRRVMNGIDLVIHLAASVGGIGFNKRYPGKIYYDNVLMNTHIIEEARKSGIKKVVTIGSVCAYPKITPIPFSERHLWNGYPEETNAPYGIAKRMLLVQAQAYRAEYGMNIIHIIPSNLYGPGDKDDPSVSHVIPALITKFLTAKKNNLPSVSVWGSGNVSRDFLYVSDAAAAILAAAERYDERDPVNIGSGEEWYIRDVVALIALLTGYTGAITWDTGKPDGQPRRLVDTSRATSAFGYAPKTPFRKGLQETIAWYQHLLS